MDLESLLKPIKYTDEQILRYYTKITKKWEDKGHSRYSLSLICDLISPAMYVPSASYFYFVSPTILPFMFIVHSTSLALSLSGINSGDHSNMEEKDGKFTINQASHFYNKIGAARMPELIMGASFAGKGFYDIYNYFSNYHPPSLSDGINNLLLATSLISNASAWYIRDRDPKILDKAPFWKTAYENIKKNIESSIPQPIPGPIP